jgi:hypothetical protein
MIEIVFQGKWESNKYLGVCTTFEPFTYINDAPSFDFVTFDTATKKSLSSVVIAIIFIETLINGEQSYQL